ncbi:MAG TPA: HEAT repeat domain-containing protein [Planctomycetota bacterium]|nr:HEAT repeat domain-containing protein [Planctomycetota bacterium]
MPRPAIGVALALFASTASGHGGRDRGCRVEAPLMGCGLGPPPASNGVVDPVAPTPTRALTCAYGAGALPPDPAIGHTSWASWWGFAQDDLLARRRMPLVFCCGDWTLVDRVLRRPTRAQITTRIAPLLREAIDDASEPSVAAAACLALAKIGEDPRESAALFTRLLASESQALEEVAALSLGVLASPDALPTLVALFDDTAEGRALVRRKEVPWRVRTFAAYALGLLGARLADAAVAATAQGHLLAFLRGEGAKRASQRDLRIAAVIALGLVPDPDRRAVATLRAYFDELRRREELIASHVPLAIAALLRDAPAQERAEHAERIVGQLSPYGPREDHVRPALAQALGVLTRLDDPHAGDVVRVLIASVERDSGRVGAHARLTALGRIAGTGAPGNDVECFLLERAVRFGGRFEGGVGAALALGVASFERRRFGGPAGETVRRALAAKMRETKDPERAAAFAIALGLASFDEGCGDLLAWIDWLRRDDFRGSFAVALGLAGSKDAAPRLRTLLRSSMGMPAVLRDSATALALLEDDTLAPMLVEALGRPEGAAPETRCALVSALGCTRDGRAVDVLCGVLRERGEFAMTRSRAAAALGALGDKEDMPWNARVAELANLLAMPPSLHDHVTGTGLLDLW